jgi:hypothetical protein
MHAETLRGPPSLARPAGADKSESVKLPFAGYSVGKAKLKNKKLKGPCN